MFHHDLVQLSRRVLNLNKQYDVIRLVYSCRRRKQHPWERTRTRRWPWGKSPLDVGGPFECMQHGTVPEISPVTQAGNWTMPRCWIDIKSHQPFSLFEAIMHSMLTYYKLQIKLDFRDALNSSSNLKTQISKNIRITH